MPLQPSCSRTWSLKRLRLRPKKAIGLSSSEGMVRSDWRIGMVGLGALGLPIAVNLRRAGFTLQVHFMSRQTFEHVSMECHSIMLHIKMFGVQCPSQPTCCDESP